MTVSLDAEVARVDKDRWLASRFAPQASRVRLAALYALNHEIARTAETVTQEAIGEIRLAWWREAIAEVAAGKAARKHPVVEAYGLYLRDLPVEPLNQMIEARGADLEPEPFAAWSDLNAYLDATAGNVMRLALSACGATAEAEFVAAAAQAWGLTGLMRSARHWQARGRSFLPRGATKSQIVARAGNAHEKARGYLLSSKAFPAVGYVALAPGYLRALERDRFRRLYSCASSD